MVHRPTFSICTSRPAPTDYMQLTAPFSHNQSCLPPGAGPCATSGRSRSAGQCLSLFADAAMQNSRPGSHPTMMSCRPRACRLQFVAPPGAGLLAMTLFRSAFLAAATVWFRLFALPARRFLGYIHKTSVIGRTRRFGADSRTTE